MCKLSPQSSAMHSSVSSAKVKGKQSLVCEKNCRSLDAIGHLVFGTGLPDGLFSNQKSQFG
jgi:hypothetical protein